MKKCKVRFIPSEKVLIVDGVKYAEKRTKYKKIDKIEHVDYVEFEQVDEKDLLEKRKLLIDKLGSSISKGDVLEEIVKSIPVSGLTRIANMLKQKGVKVKKQKGCLGIKIEPKGKGKSAYIQVFE